MKRAAKGKKPKKPDSPPDARRTKPTLARRDTPVNPIPAAHVTAPRPLGPPKSDASELGFRSETIEAAYEAWQQLREHHRAAQARLAEERRKLEQQGEFVLGAVRAARDASSPEGTGNGHALVPAGGQLDAYLNDASKKLEQAKKELEAAAEASAAKWGESFTKLRAEVRARVQRQLELAKPRLLLRVRALVGDKRILHIDRPGDDEAVLLCFLFTGRLPSRYGYLFDGSTDDPREAPPTLYAEEGVLPAHVRPDAHALEQLLDAKSEVLPVKGILPMRLPTLLRLIERGPIMEAEVRDGVGFRNVLSKAEAERIAGHLLKMKLEGWIQLELFAE